MLVFLLYWCLSLISNLSCCGSFLFFHTTARRSVGLIYSRLFFFPETSPSVRRILPTQCLCVCVCVSYFLLLWEIYFITRLYFLSSMEPFFSFSFGGDYRHRFKAKPCMLLLFLPPCFIRAIYSQRWRFSRWSALFLPPSLAECLEGQLEMKLLLSTICLTL